MLKLQWILAIVFLAGVSIVLLPDDGRPVIRFNEMHGPSVPDMIGLGLISISWLAGLVMIVLNWKKIRTRIGIKNVGWLISIYLLSCLGIGIALKAGFDWMLWPSVAVASFVNILFVFLSFKKSDPFIV